ncbi:MAG: alkaline phosphatase family protein [Synechococcus sp.]
MRFVNLHGVVPILRVQQAIDPTVATPFTGDREFAQLSNPIGVFHLAVQNGLTTAAAACSWFAEFYNRAPFNPVRDRQQNDERMPIQHGSFYWEDSYPNSHLLADAELLRYWWNPDFLLVHSRGIENAGRCFGSDSKEYLGQVQIVDNLLAHAIPRWQQSGYDIVIVSTLGMTPDGDRGDNSAKVQDVPLFCIGQSFAPGVYLDGLSQLAIAPMICQLLGFPLASTMQLIPVPGFPQGVLHPETNEVRAMVAAT